MFIHDAVLESLVCGNTQIPADDFRTTFEALKQTKVDKLEHSENLLPIRSSTGSDYGTTSNNMVINIMN